MEPEDEAPKEVEEEESVQAKGEGNGPALSPQAGSGITSLKGRGQPLPDSSRAFFEPRIGADFSGVRVHTDTRAADLSKSINAKAFTHGHDVVFGAGQYAPESSAGKKLMAHELTHVVQQRKENIQGKLIQRRVPASGDISSLIKEKKGATHAEVTERLEHVKGLRIVILRELAIIREQFLTNKLKTKVANDTLWKQHPKLKGRKLTLDKKDSALRKEWWTYYRNPAKAAIMHLLTKSTDVDAALKSDKYDILKDLLDAIITKYPASKQGDPKHFKAPPQTTTQKANLKSLLKGVDNLYTDVLSGTYNTDIEQVFGAANLGKARAKYKKAQDWLSKNSGKIESDFSGYSKRVGLGGFTMCNEFIVLKNSYISNPTKTSSKRLTLHEGMHAGNCDVGDDGGYYAKPGFDALSEKTKLANATHFEEVPRRILKISKYKGKTFTPIGKPLSSGKIRKQTNYEYAKRKASEIFRKAWSASWRVYIKLTDVYKNSANYTKKTLKFWNGVAPIKVLPYWSSVQDFTIHKRKGPAKTPPVDPVTRIDLALSEGVGEKLKHTMKKVGEVSAEKDADLPASKSALKKDSNKDKLADYNVEKTLLTVGTITKDLARDKKVIKEMSDNARKITVDRAPVGW